MEGQRKFWLTIGAMVCLTTLHLFGDLAASTAAQMLVAAFAAGGTMTLVERQMKKKAQPSG